MSYVALSLSLSLSRVRLVRIDFNRPTLIRYLNIGDMIEYQDQLAIIRKVQKGRNVQVEFVSKTSKSKDFLFFSETTSFPPLANTNTHTHTRQSRQEVHIETGDYCILQERSPGYGLHALLLQSQGMLVGFNE